LTAGAQTIRIEFQDSNKQLYFSVIVQINYLLCFLATVVGDNEIGGDKNEGKSLASTNLNKIHKTLTKHNF